MRILVIVPSFPESRGDACSPALAETILAMGKQHDIEVISLFLPQPQRHYQIENVHIFSLGAQDPAPAMRWAAPVPSAVAAAARANRRQRVDLVLGFGVADTGLATVAASRVLRVPCVVYLGSSELVARDDIGYGLARFGLRRALVRTVLRGADRVLVASPVHAALAMVVGNVTPNHVYLAPLGIRDDIFRPEPIPRDEAFAADPCPTIVSTSAFAPNKAPDVLLGAVARLLDIPWRLQFVGAGKYQPLVQQKVIRQGLADRVEFLGQLRHDEIPSRLRCASVYVQASDWEPEGVALLEAMAMGVPVVSTPTGLAPEAIAVASCGTLVRHGDDAAMAEAIRTILTDGRELQLNAVAGADKIRKTYNTNVMGTQLAKLLQQVV